MTINTELTFKPRVWEEYLEGLPEAPGKYVLLPHMSKPQRKAEERRIHKAYNLKHRKKYTRKPGHVHPNKKKATRRRRLAEKWAKNPWACVVYRAGYYTIPLDTWDRIMSPYWVKYNPAELEVKEHRKDMHNVPYGTKANPYTIYSLRLYHKKLGLLYDGHDYLLWELSCPTGSPMNPAES